MAINLDISDLRRESVLYDDLRSMNENATIFSGFSMTDSLTNEKGALHQQDNDYVDIKSFGQKDNDYVDIKSFGQKDDGYVDTNADLRQLPSPALSSVENTRVLDLTGLRDDEFMTSDKTQLTEVMDLSVSNVTRGTIGLDVADFSFNLALAPVREEKQEGYRQQEEDAEQDVNCPTIGEEFIIDNANSTDGSDIGSVGPVRSSVRRSVRQRCSKSPNLCRRTEPTLEGSTASGIGQLDPEAAVGRTRSRGGRKSRSPAVRHSQLCPAPKLELEGRSGDRVGDRLSDQGRTLQGSSASPSASPSPTSDRSMLVQPRASQQSLETAASRTRLFKKLGDMFRDEQPGVVQDGSKDSYGTYSFQTVTTRTPSGCTFPNGTTFGTTTFASVP